MVSQGDGQLWSAGGLPLGGELEDTVSSRGSGSETGQQSPDISDGCYQDRSQQMADTIAFDVEGEAGKKDLPAVRTHPFNRAGLM